MYKVFIGIVLGLYRGYKGVIVGIYRVYGLVQLQFRSPHPDPGPALLKPCAKPKLCSLQPCFARDEMMWYSLGPGLRLCRKFRVQP